MSEPPAILLGDLALGLLASARLHVLDQLLRPVEVAAARQLRRLEHALNVLVLPVERELAAVRRLPRPLDDLGRVLLRRADGGHERLSLAPLDVEPLLGPADLALRD